jgi:hypothetical protein
MVCGGKARESDVLPVCMLAKLPHALNDSPSTRPLTNPQMMRTISVCVVSILVRKCRDRVERSVVSSTVPERETFVLAPVDQRPFVSFWSSSRGKDGLGTDGVSQKTNWLLREAVRGGMAPDEEGGGAGAIALLMKTKELWRLDGEI